MQKYESLHNHTKISDGTMTHLEVLDAAEAAGFGVVAFTDHDILPDEQTFEQLRAYRGPVKWLTGIELSVEVPGGPTAAGSSLHVLGLFVDPENKELKDQCALLHDSRLVRMRRHLRRFHELGFAVTEEDCFAASGSTFVGSPHMVAAILKNPKNVAIMMRMKDEMEDAGKRYPAIGERYQRMVALGEKQYPYVLFMTSDAYYPMPQADVGAMLGLDESVRLIRGAGGIAVLAHWFYSKSKLPKEGLEAIIKAGTLDGLEIGSGPAYLEEDSKYLGDLCDKYKLEPVIGVDMHAAAEFDGFAPEWKEASFGQTEGLVEKFKPDTAWSNL